MTESPSSFKPVPLTTLSEGDCAKVARRDMCGEDCELLSAMGLTDSCRLRICRVGELCIIQVAATRLGLSSSMASKIMVRPEEATG